MAISSSEIEDLIKTHMEAQPYGIACNECGEPLEYDATVDQDLDLVLKVNPCKRCMVEANGGKDA
jgi:hypothetical protein